MASFLLSFWSGILAATGFLLSFWSGIWAATGFVLSFSAVGVGGGLVVAAVKVFLGWAGSGGGSEGGKGTEMAGRGCDKGRSD